MTAQFQKNLDAAIQSSGRPLKYELIDLGALPRTDRRGGYPTPTLLLDGHDVFGMPEPQPPLPEPT